MDFRIQNIYDGCDDIIVGRAITFGHFENLLKSLGGDTLSNVLPGRL
jgi:hypothetical protein